MPGALNGIIDKEPGSQGNSVPLSSVITTSKLFDFPASNKMSIISESPLSSTFPLAQPLSWRFNSTNNFSGTSPSVLSRRTRTPTFVSISTMSG